MYIETDDFRLFVVLSLILIAGFSVVSFARSMTSEQPDQPDE